MMFLKRVDGWKTPATTYPTGTHGRATIRRQKIRAGTAYSAEGVAYQYGKNSYRTTLEIDGRPWMVDEWHYCMCLASFAQRSRGRVLVAGLGLGLVVHDLLGNPAVEQITVIEREPDVIAAVKHHLASHSRLEIIEDDFYSFLRADTEVRNSVIWDLGVWGPDDPKDCLPIGKMAMHMMPTLVEMQYGLDCTLFRHGIDRDPLGEKFVREQPEKLVSWNQELFQAR